MKNKKCRLRQTLGLLLTAGMVISGIHFSVLPVSATEGTPIGENETTLSDAETSVSDVQEVLNAVQEILSININAPLSTEELKTISEQVTVASGKIEMLETNQETELTDAERQQLTFAKGQLESVTEKLAELAIAPISNTETPDEKETEIDPQAFEDVNSDEMINEIYQALGEMIQKVASGDQAKAQVDVFDIIFKRYPKLTDFQAAAARIDAASDLMYKSLLADYQNDLFWHDKSKNADTKEGGIKFESPITHDNINVTSGTSIFSLSVLPEYRADGGDEFTVSKEKLTAANNYLATAQAIIAENADKSDYEKLLAYKNAICDLVSYDEEAAKDGYTGSKNPWTMIPVFDNDPSTNVVCEGYSKAFQYLCDNSTFKSASTKCYTVSGTMAGGVGAGPHMWNIVSIGGSNYLVDVTNCDENGVGAPDLLFLAIPATGGTWDGTYTFNARKDISYVYDESIKTLYGESILKLSTTAYDPTKDPADDDNGSGNDKPGNDKPGNDKPGNNKPGNNKPNNNKPSSKPGSSSSGSSSSDNSSTDTTQGTQTGNTNTTVENLQNWGVTPVNPSDNNTYRLAIGGTVEMTPELLNNADLNTVAKVEAAVRNNLVSKGISNENIRVYDVALQIYVNGVWQDAGVDNFPAEGITITVPYPSGTDSTYDFVANHIFTKSMNGYSAGHIESFPENGAIQKTASGISFTVHGLSPISVGWSKASGTSTGSTASTANASPQTGDHNSIMFYMILMILAAAVMGTVYVKRIRIEK